MNVEEFFKKCTQIPPKAIYAVVLIVTIIPYLTSLNIPVFTSSTVLEFYDGFDALQPGDTVFWVDEERPRDLEHLLLNSYVMQFLFTKPGVKIFVFFAGRTADTQFTSIVMPMVENPLDKQYGVDYVFLPWVAGRGDTQLARVATQWGKVFSKDYYKTPAEELEIMAAVDSVADFDIILGTGAGGTPAPMVRQFYVRYPDLDMYILQGGSSIHGAIPYVGAGFITGLWGIPDGAAFLSLFGYLQKNPITISRTDGASLYHIVGIALIVLANLGVVYDRIKKWGGN